MLLKIGEVQSRSGLPIKTIRYYEERGLVRARERTEGGFRLFAPEVLPRLSFIRQAQALGLSLEEIGELLAIYDDGQAPCCAVKAKLQTKLAECDQRLAQLHAFRDRLQTLLLSADELAQTRQPDGICPIVDRGLSDPP